MKYTDFYEVFDPTVDFLTNPDNANLSRFDLINKFQNDGGKVLGSGSYGEVFSHPKWKYVLKVFSDDTAYLKYVRFCFKNPRPSFPVFYDKPRKIVPIYKTTVSTRIYYAVKMEPLIPMNRVVYSYVKPYLEFHYRQINKVRTDSKSVEQQIETCEKLEQSHPELLQLKDDFIFLMTTLNSDVKIGFFDLHQNNVMLRDDKTIVLSDPFAPL